MVQNEFDNEIKYRIFRNIKEILHPTISKKNISDYIVTMDESLLPARVFYPKKVTGIKNIIIYIHGNAKVTDCIEKYTDICKIISEKTDHLVIAIEYQDKKHKYKEILNEIYETVKYIYTELEKNNIPKENICLMGDSTGGNLITGINYLKDFDINKEILLYPTLSLDYFGDSKYESIKKNEEFNLELIKNLEEYYNYICYKKDLKDLVLNPLKQKDYKNTPRTLIIVGNIDSLKDEAKEYYSLLPDKNNKYVELPFYSHGFLKRIDNELEDELFKEVNDFLK